MAKDPDFQKKLKAIFKKGDSILRDAVGHLPKIVRSRIESRLDKEVELSNIKLPPPVGRKTLKFLNRYLSLRTRLEKNGKEMRKIHAKMDRLLDQFPDTRPEDRLTRREVGMLGHFYDVEVFSKELTRLGLDEGELQPLIQLSQASHVYFDRITALVKGELETYYKDGDLVLWDQKKRSEVLGHPPTMDEVLVGKFTKGYSHAAKIYHDKEGELMSSHIMTESLVQEPLNIYHYCIADIWELNLAPLVPPKMEGIMKEMYGKEWKEAINRKYQIVEKQLHRKRKPALEGIVNAVERRLEAGFANYPSVMSTLTGTEVKGHHQRDTT